MVLMLGWITWGYRLVDFGDLLRLSGFASLDQRAGMNNSQWMSYSVCPKSVLRPEIPTRKHETSLSRAVRRHVSPHRSVQDDMGLLPQPKQPRSLRRVGSSGDELGTVCEV